MKNIAEILKYCPKGTKLYSLVEGDVTLEIVNDDGLYPIVILRKDGRNSAYTSEGLLFANNLNGDCVLFPSKDQRDWSKFKLPVKRGDIMMGTAGACPFIATGKFDKYNSPKYICGINSLDKFQLPLFNGGWTPAFYIPASEEAKKKLFDKMEEAGYRWNADTLELEKILKFKEGDVLINKDTNALFLSTGVVINDIIQGYYLFDDGSFISTSSSISSLELASTEDRDKLFFVMAKEGYRYDKEQHKLVRQFNSFDKVLVRNQTDEKWSINLFSYYDKGNKLFPYVCLDGRYPYCVPYEGNEYFVGKTVNIH